MLLAAGRGTRLDQLTRERPKALIEVGGVPMLEWVARRVVHAGADRLIINVHPFPDQIETFVSERDGFGVDVAFSREEPEPLETGGGLLLAAPLFRRDAPFVIHNTDVLTDFPLPAMYEAHQTSGALATLATGERDAARYLHFDEHGLCGHELVASRTITWVREPAGEVRRLAFGCVHVASPELLDHITERGKFSIMRMYLRLAGEGYRIMPYPIGNARWLDIGTPERLAVAHVVVEEGSLSPP